MTAAEKITKARAGLVLDFPFFGTIALQMGIKEDPDQPTAWTDGKEIGYNPDFIDGLTLAEVKGLLAHEVMHVALCHHLRRGSRKQDFWNVSADYAINGIIKDQVQMPPGYLFDPSFQDLSAEGIYSKVFGNVQDRQQGQGQGKGEGQGEACKNGTGTASEAQSGKSGTEQGPPKPEQYGEVRDSPTAGTEAEKKKEEAEVKTMVSQAHSIAKASGNTSADLDRLIDKLLKPKIDWKAILRNFIQETNNSDHSWNRPNRRFIHSGLYLPAKDVPTYKPLTIAIDTSGSVDQGLLDQFSAEISQIMAETKATLTIIYCDSSVGGTETFTTPPVDLHPIGGGGTRFMPVFDWIQENNHQCNGLIYLTDLYSPDTRDIPLQHYPVLWITPTDPDSDHLKGYLPAIGEIVFLDMGE